MNIWGIPNWLEQEVRARDKHCIYCGIEMIQNLPRGHSRRVAATWEHIINDARIITRENIALCCSPCNSSKGARLLSDWIQSPYCTVRGVNKDTVAQIVKDTLQQPTTRAPNHTLQPTAGALGVLPSSGLTFAPAAAELGGVRRPAMTDYPQGALNVDLDWGSTGIWVRVDAHWANASSYTRYGLPEWLVRRFDYWSSWYESHDPGQADWPDAANLEAYGLSLAIDLKLFLQDAFRVFYHGEEILPVPFNPDNVPLR